jgi:hypothetical protein
MTPGDSVGTFGKFAAPTVANGRVYVATFDNKLVVYGALDTCTGSQSCAGILGAPPELTVACPLSTDFYVQSPSGTQTLASTGMSYATSMSDYAGAIVACPHGLTTSCTSFSTYSDPGSWCPAPPPPPPTPRLPGHSFCIACMNAGGTCECNTHGCSCF